MGFLELFSGGGPSGPRQVPLDQMSQGLLSGQLDRASRGVEEFAQEANQGHERVDQLGAQGGDQGSSGVSSSLRDAISTKYGATAKRDLNQLRESNRINAEITKGNKLGQASANALNQQAMKIESMRALAEAQIQNDQARATFVSSLTGLAAIGMGMYAGSRKPAPPSPVPQQDAGGMSSFTMPVSRSMQGEI